MSNDVLFLMLGKGVEQVRHLVDLYVNIDEFQKNYHKIW